MHLPIPYPRHVLKIKVKDAALLSVILLALPR